MNKKDKPLENKPIDTLCEIENLMLKIKDMNSRINEIGKNIKELNSKVDYIAMMKDVFI